MGWNEEMDGKIQDTIKVPACQNHCKIRSGSDQVRRKNPCCEQACRFGLGRIEADLVTALEEILKRVGGQAQVAPGFEKAESDILEGAKADGEGLAKQAAFFDQLKDEMGNLEQEVEDLTGGTLLGVGVFKIEAPIFLDIEALVLDFPTQATTLVGQGVNIVLGRDEIGQPLEGGRPGVCTAIGFGFLANHHIQDVAATLAICIGQGLDPAKILHNLELSPQK